MPPQNNSLAIEVCPEHSGITSSLDSLKDSDKSQWEHINGIEKALSHLVPVWTAIVLMVMGTVTGSALTFAGMMFKFAGKIAP